MNNQYKTKQVIVMRTDLNMRKGKMAAQAGHASMMFLTRRLIYNKYATGITDAVVYLSEVEMEWLASSYAKICVGVISKTELEAIIMKAEGSDLEVNVVTDNGATEFHGVPTVTCCAIGPDYSDKIDSITGNLKLL